MNRRRQKLNPLNAPSLARWIVIFVFLAVTGLSYVYLSIQLHTSERPKKGWNASSPKCARRTRTRKCRSPR